MIKIRINPQGKDAYLKALMGAGLSYEDALKQMKTLQGASPQHSSSKT